MGIVQPRYARQLRARLGRVCRFGRLLRCQRQTAGGVARRRKLSRGHNRGRGLGRETRKWRWAAAAGATIEESGTRNYRGALEGASPVGLISGDRQRAAISG